MKPVDAGKGTADAGKGTAMTAAQVIGEELLTVAQVAARYGVSTDSLYRWIEKGALPVVRIGPFRRIRIRARDADRLLVADEGT